MLAFYSFVVMLAIGISPVAFSLWRLLCSGNLLVPAAWDGAFDYGDVHEYLESIVGLAVNQTIFLLVWIAAALAVSALYALARRAADPGTVSNTGTLGRARLITGLAEIRRKNDTWDGHVIPQRAGLVLGFDGHRYIFDASVPHALVCGKTGSGKSRYMVIETLHLCMAAGWNLIATGKSELAELTGDKAASLGYRRLVFDLNGYPGASRYNPIDLVCEYAENGETDSAQKAARQVAADLVPLSGGSNDFFPKAARSALAAVILVVAFADIPRAQKNMASVASTINQGTTGSGRDPSAPLKDHIRALGPEHPAFAAAVEFLRDGGRTVAGSNVLSTLDEAIAIFGDEGIRCMTSASDVSMSDIVGQKSIVYVHLLEEGDPYNALFTCFFNQYWRVAKQMSDANAGALPHETAIVGDEWGNLGKVDCTGEIVTLGRSMGLHLYLFVQNLGQLRRYDQPGDGGAGRQKIIGSAGTKVALSLGATEDYEEFTKWCGKFTANTQGSSRQRGAGRDSSGRSASETATDLIKADEWQYRIPSRDGSIAIKGGENAKPGREGVFQMPLRDASETPAAVFFGLGSREHEAAKRHDFRTRMELLAKTAEPTRVWCPDFESTKSAETVGSEIEDDEFGAWDGM